MTFLHLPVNEKVKKHDTNRLRKDYIIDTLTSFDIQEIVEIGGKIIQIYEGVISRENFTMSPFKRVIENLLNLRLKYKYECNDLMQGLVELIKNSLYSENFRRDIDQEYKSKSEYWMRTQYD